MSNDLHVHDDLDAYIATFDETERDELAQAEAALDLSLLLYEARTARNLTQVAAAARSGVRQQAISRWELSHPNMKLDTLRKYLEALGYKLDLVIRDSDTGMILNPEAIASGESSVDRNPTATSSLGYTNQQLPTVSNWESAVTYHQVWGAPRTSAQGDDDAGQVPWLMKPHEGQGMLEIGEALTHMWLQQRQVYASAAMQPRAISVPPLGPGHLGYQVPSIGRSACAYIHPNQIATTPDQSAVEEVA